MAFALAFSTVNRVDTLCCDELVERWLAVVYLLDMSFVSNLSNVRVDSRRH